MSTATGMRRRTARIRPTVAGPLLIRLCKACCAALEVVSADTTAMARAIRSAVDAELQQGRTAVIGGTTAEALLLNRTAVITGLLRGAEGPGRPAGHRARQRLDVASFAGPVKCRDDADACAARVRGVTRHSVLPVLPDVSVRDDPPALVTARAGAVFVRAVRWRP